MQAGAYLAYLASVVIPILGSVILLARPASAPTDGILFTIGSMFGLLLIGIVIGFQGRELLRSREHFLVVVDTDGHDQTRLVIGFSNLRRFFRLEAVIGGIVSLTLLAIILLEGLN
jgi:cytochrome c biogenesis protein CcdA